MTVVASLIKHVTACNVTCRVISVFFKSCYQQPYPKRTGDLTVLKYSQSAASQTASTHPRLFFSFPCNMTTSAQQDIVQNVEESAKPGNELDESLIPSKRSLKRMKKEEKKRKAKEEGTVKRKKKRTDFVDDDHCDAETSYYYENGLRKVYPYYFTFSTFAKGRWYKRTLLDVFCKEFKHFPNHVFKEKIAKGQVLVNKEPVSLDYHLKDNDFISHVSHRHEVPVTTDPITIVHECDDLLVINKPSSIPCHPCGSFRHNSVIFILRKEHGYKDLRFVHRLDRLTSGLLIFAKTEAKAAEISRQVASRLVEKEYISRVDGEFPSGLIECNEPMEILSYKLGLQKVSATGKEAKTTFERISYNGKASVVRCKPHTGRTHQIRVHLQYLGFPICNDPLYNCDIWGPLKGKSGDFGKSDEELIALMLRDHDKLKYVNADLGSADELSTTVEDEAPAENQINIQKTNYEDAGSIMDEIPPRAHNFDETDSFLNADDTKKGKLQENRNSVSTKDLPDTISSLPLTSKPKGSLDTCMTQTAFEDSDSYRFDSTKLTFDPTCLDCQRQFKDPEPDDLILYLHAYRYKGIGWEFMTPLPSWASEDWQK